MIDEKSWSKFRDYIREVRLTGVQVKYIGRPSKLVRYVTGTPVTGNKMYVGDLVFTANDFINFTHMTTSFSIDGVLVSNLYEG